MQRLLRILLEILKQEFQPGIPAHIQLQTIFDTHFKNKGVSFERASDDGGYVRGTIGSITVTPIDDIKSYRLHITFDDRFPLFVNQGGLEVQASKDQIPSYEVNILFHSVSDVDLYSTGNIYLYDFNNSYKITL